MELFKRFSSKEDKELFNKQNARINLSNSGFMLMVIMTFEVLLILRIILFEARPIPDRQIRYLICYSALLLLSGVVHVIIIILRKSKNDVTKEINILTYVYCTGIVLWSIVITLYDSLKYENMIVYLTIIVATTSALRLKPLVFISIEIGGLILLLVLLFLTIDYFGFSQVINLTVFTSMFLIISVTKYNSTVTEFYNNMEIKKQKEKLEELNDLLEEEKKTLEVLARTDQLTGLFNRCTLKENAEKQVNTCYQKKEAIGFAMFDLDDFKLVNDQYGHTFGDECLKKVGIFLASYDKATVYRYGGEEFLSIADEISEKEYEQMISDIITNVQKLTFSIPNVRITLSAGFVFTIPNQEQSDEKFINAADKALYKAKKAGKNCMIRNDKI